MTAAILPLLLLVQAEPLGPGTHERTLESAGLKRPCIVHVPKSYSPAKPAPLVLAYHGAGMGARMMMRYSDLNKQAETSGFIVVYPNGTGTFPTWNTGGLPPALVKGKPDDVAFTRELLDNLDKVLKIDHQRIYACGLSNGAMMCYRLASELSERIAAIAPVAGTITVDKYQPKNPISVLHIHGTEDKLVPYDVRRSKGGVPFIRFRSVAETVQLCVEANSCQSEPQTEKLASKEGDPTTVVRKCYKHGKNDTAVVLYTIEKGGHTWPGSPTRIPFLGNTCRAFSANEVIWEFFQQHPRK